jgi:hypothetical protein
MSDKILTYTISALPFRGAWERALPWFPEIPVAQDAQGDQVEQQGCVCVPELLRVHGKGFLERQLLHTVPKALPRVALLVYPRLSIRSPKLSDFFSIPIPLFPF